MGLGEEIAKIRTANCGDEDDRRRATHEVLAEQPALDGTFEASIEQIVAQFRASTWWTADLDLDSAIRGFLIDADGPVSAVWDDETDLAEVCAQARAVGWTGGAGDMQAAVA